MTKNPRNPPLTLVGTDGTGVPEPPRPLGEHGQRLWAVIQADYGIVDTGGRELLAQACGALDTIEMLREAVERDGAIVYAPRTGVPRAHPGLRDLLGCRAFLARTLERLGLNVEAVKPVGRPGSFSSWTPK
jgi:hypothetical protein